MDTSSPVDRPTGGGVAVEESGDELVLARRTGSRPLGTVLLVLLVVYTYLFAMIPLDAMGFGPPLPPRLRPAGRAPRPRARPVALRRLPPRLLLLAVPAAVGWLFLLSWTLGQLTGLDRIRIGPAGIEHLRGSILRTRLRSIPLNEVRGLAYVATFFDKPPLLLTWGASIPLAGGWPNDREDRARLTDLVRAKLQALKARDTSAPSPPPPPSLASKHVPNRVTFSTRYGTEPGSDGAGRLSGFGCCLVPALFLNGTVAFLLLEVFSPFDWGRHGMLLLSLIPGLFLAFACVWLASETFGWRTWTFDDERVIAGQQLLGLPVERKVRFATSRLGRVVLQPLLHDPHPGREQTFVSLETGASFPPGFAYHADLLGRDGKALGTIANMTASEGLWLMRELRDCLKGTLSESETILTLPRGSSDSPGDREFDA